MGNVQAALSPTPAQMNVRTRVADANTITNSTSSLKSDRRVINRYLKRIGKQSKNDLSLDAHGFCYIPFKRFLIIIGVPDDGTGLLYFRVMVLDLDSTRGISKVHKKVAAANLTALKLGKRGSYLVMQGDEVSLALETRIKGFSYRDMAETLEDFMETAVKTNAKLEAIR
jgi:hypothetical protein